MQPAAKENLDQADRRAVERQATSQLTTLTSLLAGFGFAWFTSLVGNELSNLFSLVILIVTASTIFVLVIASIVGALLTIASEIAIREGPLRRAQTLWIVATRAGILLFLVNIAILPYRVSVVGGVICSILAIATAIVVFGAWDWIQRFSQPQSTGDKNN
jgi:hypothetical protein